MKKRFLLCPQCGSRLFYIKDKNGQNLYFYIEQTGSIIPTKKEYEDVTKMKIETLCCSDCSWSGRVSKLKKYFTG